VGATLLSAVAGSPPVLTASQKVDNS
jgi:hypothetical protein